MYKHVVNLDLYINTIKDQQELKPDFLEYTTMLIKMFNNAATNPEEFQLELIIAETEDNSATLEFQQIFSVKTTRVTSSRKGSARSGARSDTISVNQTTVKKVRALSAAFVVEDEERVK